jgi:hypothetical protein
VLLFFFSFVFIVGTWDVVKGNLVPMAIILREKRSVNYLMWFLVFTPPTLPTYPLQLWNGRIWGTIQEYISMLYLFAMKYLG